MGLRPTQCNENVSAPATTSMNHHSFLCHPEEPTCLCQVKGGMNMGKRCLPSRPRGPAPKISPARKGWVHRLRKSGLKGTGFSPSVITLK